MPPLSAACVPCRIANRHKAGSIFSAPVNARRTVPRAGSKQAALEQMKRVWQPRSAMAHCGESRRQEGVPGPEAGAASPRRLSQIHKRVIDPMAAGASSAEPASSACAGNATTAPALSLPPDVELEAAESDAQPPARARSQVLLPACPSSPRHVPALHADGHSPLRAHNRELDSLQPFSWDKCALETWLPRGLISCFAEEGHC